MPTTTYTPLANITLTGSSSTVTFSSITAGYRDLIIAISLNPNGNGNYPSMRFNGSSSTSYSSVSMYGTGSVTGSASYTQNRIYMPLEVGTTSGNITTIITQIMDYSASDKHKSVLSRSNPSTNGVEAVASRWANTSAITSISLFDANGTNFASGTSFALYGIAA